MSEEEKNSFKLIPETLSTVTTSKIIFGGQSASTTTTAEFPSNLSGTFGKTTLPSSAFSMGKSSFATVTCSASSVFGGQLSLPLASHSESSLWTSQLPKSTEYVQSGPFSKNTSMLSPEFIPKIVFSSMPSHSEPVFGGSSFSALTTAPSKFSFSSSATVSEDCQRSVSHDLQPHLPKMSTFASRIPVDMKDTMKSSSKLDKSKILQNSFACASSVLKPAHRNPLLVSKIHSSDKSKFQQLSHRELACYEDLDDFPVGPGSSRGYQNTVVMNEELRKQSIEKNAKTSEYSSKTESTIIIAIDIPSSCLDKKILKNHFQKYGSIKHVFIKPNTKQARIHFTNHKSAADAKKSGKSIHPKLPDMKLFFGSPVKKKAEDTGKDIIAQKKKWAVRTLRHTFQEKSIEERPKVNKESVIKTTEISKDLHSESNRQAFTNTDRYQILDARDKLIRSKLAVVSDVHKAKYLAATCPDMCPEKERYMRAIQQDFSIYELDNDVFDHKRAIKKYSRSSADKDEPLPHELRPGSVLLQTMDYLVTLMDLKQDDDVDVWYNYLWNRTRAIRNDIMQQHLVSKIAIKILERITRFHILCGEILCEESIDSFDPKMNAEHLLKSLQSLKELYNDVKIEGKYYRSESEFRSYEMLLSLISGSIPHEYLAFRDEVKNSLNVKFSIKVLHAIQLKNYVKFFKLMKNATFLQGCIMNRYAHQVRDDAIHVMMKCYANIQSVDIHELVDLLAFNDKSDACNFLSVFGVVVDANDMVLFDRINFISNPDALPNQQKSLVIQKLNKNLYSEIIQDGPVPIDPLFEYRPYSSFDGNGFLKPESVTAIDQGFTADTKNLHDSSGEGENIALSVSSETFNQKNSFDISLEKKLSTNLNIKNILEKQQLDTIQVIVLSEIKEEMLLHWRNMLTINQLHKRTDKFAEDQLLSTYFKKWHKFTIKTCQFKELLKKINHVNKVSIMRRVIMKWKSKVALRRAERNVKYIILHKTMIKWHELTRLCLQEKVAKKHITKKYFNLWRMWIKNRKLIAVQEFENFPATGSQLPLIEQDKMLSWGYSRKLSNNQTALQKMEKNKILNKTLEKFEIADELSKKLTWMPLPLLTKFQDDFINTGALRNIFEKYFKLIVLFYGNCNQMVINWIKTKLSLTDVECKGAVISERVIYNRFGSKCFVIVKEVSSLEDFINNFPSSSGAIILVSETDEADLYRKLKTLDINNDKLEIIRNSGSFLDNWHLSAQNIYNVENSNKLYSKVYHWWTCKSTNKNAYADSIYSLLSSFLSQFVLTPIFQTYGCRLQFGLTPVHPVAYIRLYNMAIDHVSKILSNKYLIVDCLPIELFSSSIWHKTNINDLTSVLKRVQLNEICLQNVNTWTQLMQVTEDYVSHLAGPSAGFELISEIKSILNASQINYNRNNYLEIESDWLVNPLMPPWPDIISACIFYNISNKLPDCTVYYDPSALNDFINASFWLNSQKSKPDDAVLEDKCLHMSLKRKADVSICDHKSKILNSSFLEDIQEEKTRAAKFESHLQQTIQTEEEQLDLLLKRSELI